MEINILTGLTGDVTDFLYFLGVAAVLVAGAFLLHGFGIKRR
jgi:hypothetical protein